MSITLYPTIVERVETVSGNLQWEAVGASDLAECLVPGDDAKYLRLDGQFWYAQVGLVETLYFSGWRPYGTNKTLKQLLDPTPTALTKDVVFKCRVENYEPGDDVTTLLARHLQGFGESPLSLTYDITHGTGSNTNLRNKSVFSAWSAAPTFADKTFVDTTDLANVANLNATVLRSGVWKLGLSLHLQINGIFSVFDLSEVKIVLTETNPAAFKVRLA